jgi:hypothetical protein
MKRELRKAQLVVIILLSLAFGGGYGVSMLRLAGIQTAPVQTSVTDFEVVIPEGQTVVIVTELRADDQEIGKLVVQRNGSEIQGIPERKRTIAPRAGLSVEDAVFFRRELDHIFVASDSPWEKANKIRSWLSHSAVRVGGPGLKTRIPRDAYQQMRAGEPVLCGNLAEIYVALCEAAGLTARVVGLSVLVRNGLFGDTHAGAEVWLPEMGGWIYQDPTFDCYWKVQGRPASALALHDAVMAGETIQFTPYNQRTDFKLRNNYIDPRLYFRYLTYEYRAGGPLLYFADKRLEPLNLTDRNWVQTSERTDIQRLDVTGNTIVERIGEIAPGVFLQLLDGSLFIRDRREWRPGIRVRSQASPVRGCAHVHQRAEALGLFSRNNLARNPSFRLASQSGELADEWQVAGPIEVITVAGGQAMVAGAGGRLWQRIQVDPHGKYLLYARINVSRGVVTWSIADSARGAQSTGPSDGERISEFVSDVVESQSGYLDIKFEVPAGGAFRVLDVIVTEAPRFTP